MNAPQIHQPPRAVQNAEHQHNHEAAAGERPEIDRVEVPRIVREHYGTEAGEARE